MKNSRTRLAIIVAIIAGFAFLLGLIKGIEPSENILPGLALFGFISVVIAFLLLKDTTEQKKDW